jgi:transcriptional repressor NF-X1
MPCGETLRQECFCGKVGRKVNCTGQFMGAKSYSCEEVCGKSLACGNHKCEKICHEGACEACPRDVDLIRTCPCGRTQLKDVRKSCLDPIPSCDKVKMRIVFYL